MRVASLPSRRLLPIGLVILHVICLVALFLLLSRTAHAQVITETNGVGPLDYYPPDDTKVSGHPNNYDATWISYEDCESSIDVGVSLSVSPPDAGAVGDYVLQAFATTTGADCGSDVTMRSGATGVCWQVGIGKPNVANVKATAQATYYVPVRDILRGIGQPAGTGLAYTAGTESACHVATVSGVIPVTVWFMLVDPSLSNVTTEVAVQLSAELIGPAPPTTIKAGVGDGLLVLSWTPSADPTTFGYNIFIDPLPGHEPADGDADAVASDATAPTTSVCPDAASPDAGTCHTATVYEAGAAGGTCPSTVLTGGVTGTADAGATTDAAADADASSIVSAVVSGYPPTASQLALLALQVDGMSQASATIKGLKNGVVYTVAIAAIDGLEDNGPLSGPACSAPSAIVDFYDRYGADGGRGGGGFCAIEGVGLPATTSALALALSTAALALGRRRRARRRT